MLTTPVYLRGKKSWNQFVRSSVVSKSAYWSNDLRCVFRIPWLKMNVTEQKNSEADNWPWAKIVLIVLFSLLIITTIIGNTLVILSVITTRRLRTVTNLFVMSLAVADWLVGIFVMPPAVLVFSVGESSDIREKYFSLTKWKGTALSRDATQISYFVSLVHQKSFWVFPGSDERSFLFIESLVNSRRYKWKSKKIRYPPKKEDFLFNVGLRQIFKMDFCS